MKIIVAGYPKTGTKSMCAALTFIGYETYDFFEHWWYHSDRWIKILENGGTVEDFRHMYENVDAVTDVPAFFFWEEIHHAFPDAKIILTIRDEESWYKSFLKQRRVNVKASMSTLLRFFAIATMLNPFGLLKFRHYCVLLMRVLFGATMEPVENELIDQMRFRRHNSYVMHTAPKDKLLVYKVSDGWKPLCEFLGVDMPDVPFPRKNVGSSVTEDIIRENPIAIANMQKIKTKCFYFFSGTIVLVLFLNVFLTLLF